MTIRLFIFTDLVILPDTEPIEENKITKETASKRSFRISQQKQCLCRFVFNLISFHATQTSVFEEFLKRAIFLLWYLKKGLIFFLETFYNPLLHYITTIKIGMERKCLKIILLLHLFQTF